MKVTEIENLRKFARSWNNLDINHIKDCLAEDFVYQSQWVLFPVVGNSAFLNYLDLKFTAIKLVRETELMAISAELAFYGDALEKPCLILSQITVEGIRQVTILMETISGKIQRIEVCFIPDPTDAILTGEIPK